MEAALYHPQLRLLQLRALRDWAARRLFHQRERRAALWDAACRAIRRDLGNARPAGSISRLSSRERITVSWRADVLAALARAASGYFCPRALPDRRAVSDPSAATGSDALLQFRRPRGMGRVSRDDGSHFAAFIFPTSCSTPCRCICSQRQANPRNANGASDWSIGLRRKWAFVERPFSDQRLRASPEQIAGRADRNIRNRDQSAALDWLEALAPKLERGVVLIADYGLPAGRILFSGSRPAARCNPMRDIASCRRRSKMSGRCDLTDARRMDQPGRARGRTAA